MKRLLSLLLAAVMALSLAACGGAPAGTTAPPETTVPPVTTLPPVTTAPAPPASADIDALYPFLKNWVIENGILNGDYVIHSKTADHYGGYAEENFNLAYWGDTDTVEFCLHSVVDEMYSLSFYLSIPKVHTGSYEYITTYYERETGISVCESRGLIEAASFTTKYPLSSTDYFGPVELQDQFMELSRVGLCDAISCLREFLVTENTGYTLEDLGFARFDG